MTTVRECYQCGTSVRGGPTLCYRCSYGTWWPRLRLALRLWRCEGYDGRPTSIRDAFRIAGLVD